MTVRMKAIKTLMYAGRRLHPGDEFDARGKLGRPGSDATVLAAVKLAAPVIAAPVVEMRVAPLAVAVRNYQTRDMTAAPAPSFYRVPDPPRSVIKVDGADVALDDMDKEALHELAERLGVKVHHMAGAAKVRQALVEAQKDAA